MKEKFIGKKNEYLIIINTYNLKKKCSSNFPVFTNYLHVQFSTRSNILFYNFTYNNYFGRKIPYESPVS